MSTAVRLTRHRIRQVSAAMLVVWLFLFAAGVAQACITRAAAAPSPAEHCDFHAAHHAQGHAAPDGATVACEKLCTEAPAPVPKSSSAPADLSPDQLPDAALPVLHWQFAPGLQAADAVPPDAIADPPVGPPPLSIVFLRLTL
jgi:hypothetical protein